VKLEAERVLRAAGAGAGVDVRVFRPSIVVGAAPATAGGIPSNLLQGFIWLLATLASSTWAVWVALIHPQGSTAALVFLFLPLWNVVVVGPVGALLTILWNRYAARRAGAASDRLGVGIGRQ